MLMQNKSVSPQEGLVRSRSWLIGVGLLSLLVGFMAIGSPLFFSVIIAQFLGIFALVSGVISLVLALVGKHSTHRLLDALLAIIRIAAGLILLSCVKSSMAVITLIFAIYLVVEGVSSIIGALKLRQHKGWSGTLVNGIVALALGLMVYARWPTNAAWVLGLFYGINSIFWGMSLLMLGFSTPKPAQTLTTDRN